MKTNFFEELTKLSTQSNWNIVLKKITEDRYVLSILPSNPTITDEAVKHIVPINLRETAKKLDEGFFEAITSQITETDGVFTNKKEYERSLKKTVESSKMNQQNSNNERKEKSKRQTKFDETMKKIAELQAAEKYGEAIGQLQKLDPKDYPDHEKQINAKLDELKNLHASPKLFS